MFHLFTVAGTSAMIVVPIRCCLCSARPYYHHHLLHPRNHNLPTQNHHSPLIAAGPDSGQWNIEYWIHRIRCNWNCYVIHGREAGLSVVLDLSEWALYSHGQAEIK